MRKAPGIPSSALFFGRLALRQPTTVKREFVEWCDLRLGSCTTLLSPNPCVALDFGPSGLTVKKRDSPQRRPEVLEA
jgi:hypothetical protein